MSKQRHPARSTTSQIWRTVVFAGAMLGTAACGGKQSSSTTPTGGSPGHNEEGAAEAAPQSATPAGTPATPSSHPATPAADPCQGADPCGDTTAEPAAPEPRPRTPANPRPTGRGFILS